MTSSLPNGQREIARILRWNIDHPGIIEKNPAVDLAKWTLEIDGEVENPIKLTWSDFRRLSASDCVADFHCVEGWSITGCKWRGVKLTELAGIVQPKAKAKYVSFSCYDGYTTSLGLAEALQEHVLLAFELNGQPLDEALGGPVRVVVPDKYAYKSAMWIKRIVFTETRELGYWEKKGYSQTADVWKNDRFAQWRKRRF
ncbi:MAG: molybdopterin-dependent oxidoreductase [Candidatus Bathyarchaeota archaeon]|nr:MAG: molybdopterin-dependent oxidoreductase [Candidatus Bathyarchaeota archaeon]